MSKSSDRCETDTVDECNHIDGRVVNVTVDGAGEKYEWRRHADEHFPGHRSSPPHPGNVSEMVRFYVRSGMREREEDGPIEVSPNELSSQDEMLEEIQVLRTRNRTLQTKLEETEQELEKTERELRRAREDVVQYMARPKTDQLMLEIGLVVTKALEEPRTLEELAEILRQHGVDAYLDEIQGIEEPPEEYDDLLLRTVEDLEELADRFLDELEEKGLVEVTEEYGRYVYRATGDV